MIAFSTTFFITLSSMPTPKKKKIDLHLFISYIITNWERDAIYTTTKITRKTFLLLFNHLIVVVPKSLNQDVITILEIISRKVFYFRNSVFITSQFLTAFPFHRRWFSVRFMTSRLKIKKRFRSTSLILVTVVSM